MKKNLLFSLWLTILTLFSSLVFGQEIDNINCLKGEINNNQMVFNTSKFTITHSKGSSSNFASYTPWRVYTNNIVNFKGSTTVSKINKVLITAESSTYASIVTNSSVDTNNIGTKNVTTSGSVVTITFTGDVKEFKITPSSQTRWENISIEYELIPTNNPPTVNDKTIPGTYGVLLTNGNIIATGSVTSWLEPTGNIPSGISFNINDGVFSGTPTQAGNFVAKVKAMNDHGESNEATVTFNIARGQQSITPELSTITGNINETSASLPTATDQGETITYTSSSPSIVSVDGNILSYNAIGNAIITATVDGTTNLEDFTTSFNVKVIDPSLVYNGKGIFEKINSINSLTDGYYVVTNETGLIAMNNSNTENYFESENVVLNSENIVNPLNNIVWKIEKVANSYSIYNDDSEIYVSLLGNSNAAHTSSELNDNSKWNITYSNAKFTVLNLAVTNRQLSYNTANPRFAAYGNANQQELQLYKLNSTIWNGSKWSHGVPTSSVHAIITGDLEVTSNLEAKSIIVEETGSIVVKSGNTLKVENTITNNATADKFVIESEANLLQVNVDAINIGAITVLQNSSEMVRNDMTFWSSPVSGQNVRNFSPETLANRFWTYDESLDEFSQLFAAPNNFDPLNYNFENGKGVAIRVKNTLPTGQTTQYEGRFVGNLNNGDISVGVVNTANGYNLVGNPYASTINVESFLDNNQGVGSIYFWTHRYPVGSAQYSENYSAITRAGSVSGNESVLIQKGQGFIVGVDASTTAVEFKNSMREAGTAAFFRSQPTEKHRIWLSLNQNDNKFSQTLVAYLDGATNDIDSQIDAKVLQASANSIYNVINEDAYAIQGRALPFATEDEVNLGFIASNAGEYQIKLEDKDGIFAQDQDVYLLDRTLNQTHKLNDGVYNFTSEAGTFNTRFAVVYVQRNLGTDNLSANESNISIYTTSKGVNVASNKSELASLKVFDLQGKIIFEQYNINSKFIEVKLNYKGVYVLNITTVDGASLSKKIIK